MILKYLTKFASDILPSVAATVIGAYVVNHYIINKPADPPAAAAASTALPKKIDDAPPEALVKADPRPDTAAAFDAAVSKSKSEKASDKAEKAGDKASVVDKRSHQATPRDKATAKAQPETGSQDDRRDANELARAAIERLRASKDSSAEARAADAPRIQEQPRLTEQPRAPEQPRVATVAPLQPLPPAINVAPRETERVDVGITSAAVPADPGPLAPRNDDPLRLSPPADIPGARPIDLQARSPASIHTSVTEDVLSAAKSVFHAVVPR